MLSLHIFGKALHNERVFQCFSRLDSFLWRPPNHLLDQLDEFRVFAAGPALDTCALICCFLEPKLLSPLAFLEKMVRRGSDCGVNHIHLFVFVSGGKEWGSSIKLENHTPQTPNINFSVIWLN